MRPCHACRGRVGWSRAQRASQCTRIDSYADTPPLEELLYPGGRGTRPQLSDDLQRGWVRRQRAAVPLMTSVCTGSLVYAAADLLSGRPATTHGGALDLLADPTRPSMSAATSALSTTGTS